MTRLLGAHDSRRGRERDVVKMIARRKKRERKGEKNSVHLGRNVYFQKASPASSTRSPSKILGSPEPSASLPCHRGVFQLKDGVYCFWRNTAARSCLLPPPSFWSAISVYLSAGFFFLSLFPVFTLENTQIECAITPFVWNKHQMPCAALSS